MNCKQELEYLAMIVQDFIGKQDRSVQIAMAEKAQYCVSQIEAALMQATPPVVTEPTDSK